MAVVAYVGACGIGLGLAVMGMSKRIVLRQAARLYIEVMRGVPIIVLLLYVAFVLVPGVIAGLNCAGGRRASADPGCAACCGGRSLR